MGTNQSIAAAESDLRELVESVLREKFVENWLDESGLPDGRLSKIHERMSAEGKRRPGALADTDVSRYFDFYDLGTIIRKNWDLFKAALGPERNEFLFYFSRLSDLRDPDAHNRALLPFENDLAAGIAGEIRNRVTIYRSEMGPNKEYYPRIESVRDSFGHEIRPATAHSSLRTGMELRVGDTISFECAGWDPNGREVNWELYGNMTKTIRPAATSAGTDVTLSITLERIHVGEYLEVRIDLIGTGEFHRHSPGYDDAVSFTYSVIPPLD